MCCNNDINAEHTAKLLTTIWPSECLKDLSSSEPMWQYLASNVLSNSCYAVPTIDINGCCALLMATVRCSYQQMAGKMDIGRSAVHTYRLFAGSINLNRAWASATWASCAIHTELHPPSNQARSTQEHAVDLPLGRTVCCATERCAI